MLISSAAYSQQDTHRVYEDSGDYYLKSEPLWVPITSSITIIIPIYSDGDIIKISNNNGQWVAENIPHSEFNSKEPIAINDGSVDYQQLNGDEYLDMIVSLGGQSNATTLQILRGAQSSFYTVQTQGQPRRRVIYVHTDLLGSPVAETDTDGNRQ